MSSGATSRVQTAPVWPVAALAVVLALALGLGLSGRTGGSWLLPLAGYLVGAIGAAVLLPVYRLVARSRQGRTFRRRPGLDKLAFVLALGALLCGLYCAFLLATELAK